VTTRRHVAPLALLVAGVSAVLALYTGLAGCSHRYSADGADAGSLDGTGVAGELLAPRSGEGGGRFFYPLQVGDHWDWRIHTVSQITTDAGPQPPDTTRRPWSAEIVGTSQVGARTYYIQAEYDPRVVVAPPPTGFLLREDRMGLFEHDASGNPDVTVEGESGADPVAAGLAAYVDRTVADAAQRPAFARAAALVAEKISIMQLGSGLHRRRQTGADPGELTMLSYPLRPGVSWIVRDSPRFVRTVVGLDMIHVPLGTFPAWGLRGGSELFGPNDRVRFWYSRLGLLRIRFHAEADAVDNTGAVIGRVAFDSDQSLTGVRLERPHALPALVAGPEQLR